MKDYTKQNTKNRAIAILTLFSFFALFLLTNVFRLSYLGYDYYKNKTYDQVTTSSVLKAKRGNIYDSNLNLLAKSNTSWRIFISTKDLRGAEKEKGVDYTEIISQALSSILGTSKESLYNKIKEAKQLDLTLEKSATEDEYKKIIKFIGDCKLEGILLTEAESSRYYPEQTLAAHVIGFTGSDNQGLYGLEYYYNDILSGEDGYYVYAKDANGATLDTEYSDYFPATDGYSIVTTLDSYIQLELESVIEKARVNHDAQNRVTGIVMDSSTGAILAMATTTPFNPNSPFTLDELSQKKLNESGLLSGTEEYKKYKNELLQTMWSNKALSETYEPGSTFKIITVSSALDLGVASLSDKFSCKGYQEVGGWKIKCHKTTGHGSGFNLAYGLQMSCNPCMMTLAERVGASNFYKYVERFGYFEKSGIDLPSEASTIFHKEENIGSTELATASFGQRFKVSVINHLTAISSVANGGKLLTPYLAERIIDSNGKTIYQHKIDIRREVVSEDVAESVSKILIDGVNGDGGAKNAGVAGYDIAAKTGTSQKFDVLDENGNSYLRIGSTVAYALNDSKGISAIIVVDEPQSNVKYGSVVAAPYVSELMEKILPYLDYKSSVEPDKITLENYVGMNINSAKSKLDDSNISYEIIGNGNTVISQTPTGGEVMNGSLSRILLYTDFSQSEILLVPDLMGLKSYEALKKAINAGFNVMVIGAKGTKPDADDVIVEQSLPGGEKAKQGSIIIIRVIHDGFKD